jgi:hypothetical protein
MAAGNQSAQSRNQPTAQLTKSRSGTFLPLSPRWQWARAVSIFFLRVQKSCPHAHHWHNLVFNCLRFRVKHPRSTWMPTGTTTASYSGHRGPPRALPPRHRLGLVNLNAADILTDLQDHQSYLAIDARALEPRRRQPRGELLPSLDPSRWIQIQWILFC